MLDLIPVCYTPEMSIDVDSFSPSAGKPQRVVASWLRAGFAIEVVRPEPVTEAMLCLAHDADFVAGILAGKRKNGFGNRDRAVAQSLLFTNGAMLHAGRLALANQAVAVAPCSGFHHAAYNSAFGYCTFNGLLVTACQLKQEGRVERVGILDFDMHYGDGSQQIIDQLDLAWITHYSAGQHYFSFYQADEFLARIDERIAWMADCDLILYQAGADPHRDDPLGGFLSTEQLYQRDLQVFQAAKKLGIPIAWNLAGGYQVSSSGSIEKLLQIHDNTMRACQQIFGSAI